jgi:hypothetical protein
MKNISKIVLILILSLGIISCEKDNKEFSTLNLSEFENIGKTHNQALDFINTSYKKSKLAYKSSVTEDEQIQFLINNLSDYLKDKEIIINGILVNEFPMPSVKEFKDFYTTLNNSEFGDFEPYKTKEATISDIEQIEITYTDGVELENYQHLATASTFKSSIEYWKTEEIKNKELNKSSGEINWYSIALSDATGAYSGAQWGAIGGGPAGAVGGAISMGILSSAYSGFIASLW